MVTFERELHRHTHGEGIEDIFCLARNKVTGTVFVRQKWARDTLLGSMKAVVTCR
jgi:hypothetical protein